MHFDILGFNYLSEINFNIFCFIKKPIHVECTSFVDRNYSSTEQ